LFWKEAKHANQWKGLTKQTICFFFSGHNLRMLLIFLKVRTDGCISKDQQVAPFKWFGTVEKAADILLLTR